MMDEHDLTDPHGEAEALRRENARLRRNDAILHDTIEKLLSEGAQQLARAEAAEAALAASRAPDPVVNAGSCQPVATIDSLFDQIRSLMDAAKDQADRYGHIAATIRVNALRHGATDAEAEAMVRGETNFISWMFDVIEKRALPAAPVAEALTPQPDAELDALVEKLRSFVGDGHTRFAGKTMCESAADAITALRAQQIAPHANADMQALLARVPAALNSAFGAGIEEREGGSVRRQAKLLEPVDKLRDDIRAALSDLAKMKGE